MLCYVNVTNMLLPDAGIYL